MKDLCPKCNENLKEVYQVIEWQKERIKSYKQLLSKKEKDMAEKKVIRYL